MKKLVAWTLTGLMLLGALVKAKKRNGKDFLESMEADDPWVYAFPSNIGRLYSKRLNFTGSGRKPDGWKTGRFVMREKVEAFQPPAFPPDPIFYPPKRDSFGVADLLIRF